MNLHDDNLSKDENGSVSEVPLCFSCLAPSNVRDHFCKSCQVPLSSYAAIAPFERILAEGALLRAATDRPRSLFILLGVWVIILPGPIGAFVALLGSGFVAIDSVILLIAIVLTTAILTKVTRNYYKQRRVKSS